MDFARPTTPIPAPTEKQVSIDNEVPSTSLALRAQKKILSKISNRGVIKHIVSDTSVALFDSLYDVLKDYYSKTEAEKTVNRLTKLSVKLGVMIRENQLSPSAEKLAASFRAKLRSLALTIMSFARVDYSYDRSFLIRQLGEAKQRLELLVGATLSEKSKRHVAYVFDHLSDGRLLDQMFQPNGEYHSTFCGMVVNLEKLVDGADA
uniref:Tumor necrosis factor alpha-induced protein 8-like protein n=1 Tax=Panagrellus redivivus TaxID=6233 RepID=A0A7E4VLH3_PANRE